MLTWLGIATIAALLVLILFRVTSVAGRADARAGRRRARRRVRRPDRHVRAWTGSAA